MSRVSVFWKMLENRRVIPNKLIMLVLRNSVVLYTHMPTVFIRMLFIRICVMLMRFLLYHQVNADNCVQHPCACYI